MSYSSLWLIDKNFIGHKEKEYRNSWLFSPIVWEILSDKYLPRVQGHIQRVIGFNGEEVWKKINEIMNSSRNTYERICWELSNEQTFFSKDINVVANMITDFLTANTARGEADSDGNKPLMCSHIIERWKEIANDIRNIDTIEYPYFVFKSTSVDDSVERWFEKWKDDDTVEKTPLTEREYLTEFVVIENGKIKEFIANNEYRKAEE